MHTRSKQENVPLRSLYASICTTVALQPLEVLKTQLQISSHRLSLLQKSRFVYQRYGLSAYWSGTVAALAKNVPGMTSYFYLISLMESHPPPSWQCELPVLTVNPLVQRFGTAFGTAFVARTVIGIVFYPLSVVKTRMESKAFAYSETRLVKALRHTYATEGLRGLYAGLLASVMRDAPYAAIFYGTYSSIKHANLEPRVSPNVYHAWASLSAGFAASMATHPFDLYRTHRCVLANSAHLQLSGTNPFSSTKPLLSFVRSRVHNPILFFDGLLPRIARRSLMSAAAWTLFDYK